MQVQTDRSGTELGAFGGVGLTLLGGVLPWTGGRGLPVTAAAVLLLGAAAGGVLLYGEWRPVDGVAALGAGATVAALALGAYGRYAGSGLRGAEPGIGLFVAGFGGLVLAGAGAHGCWTSGAVAGPGSDPRPGSASASAAASAPDGGTEEAD
jgi:hypothetical protein